MRRPALVLGVLAALVLPGSHALAAGSPAAKKQLVRTWSERLNAGDYAGTARLFSLPAAFVQGGTVLELRSYRDVARWHGGLPCAGRITSITVKGDFATVVFVLAHRKGSRCDAPGQKAAAIFQIKGGKIRAWAQIPVPEPATPPGPVA
ncbi:MAG: hypothetical protein H0W14_07405 [Actinobacteria bacterium]|nr:hypothetical protein [Actinomycetota bacterium]